MNKDQILMKFNCIVFLLFISATSDAQIESKSLRPSLVAIQVKNLDESIRWYTTYLNFSLKEKKDFPEYTLKLAFLNLIDFGLELVENTKSLKKSEVLAGNGATDITGFAKLTFTIDNVSKLYEQLSSKGASFAIRLSDSNVNNDEQFFVVLDNENNWLQFIGKKL